MNLKEQPTYFLIHRAFYSSIVQFLNSFYYIAGRFLPFFQMIDYIGL
jgi:hypothetical protein